MTKPFDATLKDLAQECPNDYLTEFDAAPTLPVSVLNVDLSTVTTAADLVLGLGQPVQEVVHIEFHASAAEDLHRDTLAYNALAAWDSGNVPAALRRALEADGWPGYVLLSNSPVCDAGALLPQSL